MIQVEFSRQGQDPSLLLKRKQKLLMPQVKKKAARNQQKVKI
jgi:hypothetical protein